MSRMPIVEAFAIVHRQSVAKVQHFLHICKENAKKCTFLLQRAHKLTRISRYSCVSGAKVVHFADIQKGFFRLVRKVL